MRCVSSIIISASINVSYRQENLAEALSGLRHLRLLRLDIGYIDQDAYVVYPFVHHYLRLLSLTTCFGTHIPSLATFAMPVIHPRWVRHYVPGPRTLFEYQSWASAFPVRVHGCQIGARVDYSRRDEYLFHYSFNTLSLTYPLLSLD